MTATNYTLIDEEMPLFKIFVAFLNFFFSKCKYRGSKEKMGLSHSSRSYVENDETQIDNISNGRKVDVNKKRINKQENKNFVDKNKNTVMKLHHSINVVENWTQTDEIVSSFKNALKRLSQHTQTTFGKELRDTDSQTDCLGLAKPSLIDKSNVSQQIETVHNI